MTTVYDDVAFGPRNEGLNEQEVAEKVKAALETVGLAHLGGRAPYKLSGGEKKSASIATVLAMDCSGSFCWRTEVQIKILSVWKLVCSDCCHHRNLWMQHGAILSSIKNELQRIKAQGDASLIFVDAALMVETGLYQFMPRKLSQCVAKISGACL